MERDRQSEEYQLAAIEEGLAEQNEYYGCGMTEEQLRRAARIIMNREPVDEEGRAQQARYQRESRARKLLEQEEAV